MMGEMHTTSYMEDIFFSILIGGIPTTSMLIASFALMNLKIPPLIEACFQNFCAGLILAAVAMELLPLMAPSSTLTPFCSALGTSIGFIFGIAMINGLSQIIDSFESDEFEHEHTGSGPSLLPKHAKCDSSCKNYLANLRLIKNRNIISEITELSNNSIKKDETPEDFRKSMHERMSSKHSTDRLLPWKISEKNLLQSQLKMAYKTNPEKYNDKDNENTKLINNNTTDTMHSYTSIPNELTNEDDAQCSIDIENSDIARLQSDCEMCVNDGYDHEPILYAAIAIATPAHRAHIKEHFIEIMNAITALEINAYYLMSDTLTDVKVSEHLAEEIDEEIHMLQYRLDHSRRLLEGSEIDISAQQNLPTRSKNTSWWTAPEKRDKLEGCLGSLKYMAKHLLEHIDTNNISIPILREIHGHIDDMDNQLNLLHKATEDASFIWRRLTKVMGMPPKGSFVPPSLIIPVAIDSFVDGFLIGVACALSRRAGCILAMANCLEMAFLGMAVSMRVCKCTGSSVLLRYACIIVPPFIMLLATVIGALTGSVAKLYPMVFVIFVAFGVIALLYLVFNELLVEAREAQEGEVRWWVTAIIFLGIYCVLMLDQIVS